MRSILGLGRECSACFQVFQNLFRCIKECRAREDRFRGIAGFCVSGQWDMTNGKADTIQELRDELFQKQGGGWFRVLSGSMYPLIEINDRIFIRSITPSDVRPRDIVLFKSEGAFVAHRVMRVDRNSGGPLVMQKGDASAHASLIAPESIVGKVSSVEKRGCVLDLATGRGRMLNGFLGMKSCMTYRLAERVDRVAGGTRNTPGFIAARALFGITKKAFGVFQRILVKVLVRTARTS